MTINAHSTKHYFLTKGVFLMNCFQRNSLVSFSCNNFSLKMKLVLKLTQVFNTIVSFLCRLYTITHSIPMVTWTTLKKLPKNVSMVFWFGFQKKNKTIDAYPLKKILYDNKCPINTLLFSNKRSLMKGWFLWKHSS